MWYQQKIIHLHGIYKELEMEMEFKWTCLASQGQTVWEGWWLLVCGITENSFPSGESVFWGTECILFCWPRLQNRTGGILTRADEKNNESTEAKTRGVNENTKSKWPTSKNIWGNEVQQEQAGKTWRKTDALIVISLEQNALEWMNEFIWREKGGFEEKQTHSIEKHCGRLDRGMFILGCTEKYSGVEERWMTGRCS